MARSISNVEISTDTFATWIARTNLLADAVSVYAVTVESNTTGANATGNGFINGYFSANVISASESIRGGTITTSANLNIISNAIFTGALLKSTSNVYIEASNSYTNSSTSYVVGGQHSVSSNLVLSGSFVNVVTSNAHINSAVTYINGGLANITSNVSITSGTVGITSVSTITGNTTLKANSTLTNLVLTTNNTVSNLTISVDTTTVGGNVAISTDALFVDSVLKKAGVNTASLDSTFKVNGTSNLVGNVTVGGLFGSGNTTITGFANVTTNLNVVGGSTVNGAFVVNNTASLGNTTITGRLSLEGNVFFITASNTDLGSNTTSGLSILSFPVADFTSGKITSTIKNGTNVHISEMVLAHNTTDSYITVYGSVSSVAGANLGSYSTTISGGNVLLQLTQKNANSSVKLLAHMFK